MATEPTVNILMSFEVPSAIKNYNCLLVDGRRPMIPFLGKKIVGVAAQRKVWVLMSLATLENIGLAGSSRRSDS